MQTLEFGSPEGHPGPRTPKCRSCLWTPVWTPEQPGSQLAHHTKQRGRRSQSQLPARPLPTLLAFGSPPPAPHALETGSDACVSGEKSGLHRLRSPSLSFSRALSPFRGSFLHRLPGDYTACGAVLGCLTSPGSGSPNPENVRAWRRHPCSTCWK